MGLPLKGPTSPKKIPLNPLQPQSHSLWHIKQGHTIDGHTGQSALDQGEPPPLLRYSYTLL